MPTLLEKLQTAGLPVISASEDGNIQMNATTPEQDELFISILREHFNMPAPPPIVYKVPVYAPDFIVASPKTKDNPREALDEAVQEARKGKGRNKSIALIALSLAHYLDEVEKRLSQVEEQIKKKGK